MPVAGRKPKPDGQAVTRHPQKFEWIEVVDLPFDGKVPALPAKRRVMLPFGDTTDIALHPLTKAWWRRVSRMPHCRLWSESDWGYAIASALVADAFHYGHTPSATELARREKVMGVTADARRDLRLRYVDPKPEKPQAGDATVTRLDDYRDL